MSWLQRINDEVLTITCGDGKRYNPIWKDANSIVEYNTSEYEFINVEGTFVDRRKPKGARYDVHFIFQGEDNLDQRDAFLASCANPKYLELSHPYYGVINVQPLGWIIDNTQHNVTAFNGMLIETITDLPIIAPAPLDQLIADKATLDELQAQNYADDAKAKVKDAQKAKTSILQNYNETFKKINNTIDAEKYRNAFNTASSFINGLVTAPLQTVRLVQTLLNMPFQFQNGVEARIDMLRTTLDSLIQGLITNITRPQKKYFEMAGGAVVSAMALAAVTTPGYYANRSQVNKTVENILGAHNEYLLALESIQSQTGGLLTSFMPAVEIQNELSQLISYAVNNLFAIANNARQEITILLPEDTNIFLFASKYKTQGQDIDTALDELILANGIGPNEIIQLKKDRRITYFV